MSQKWKLFGIASLSICFFIIFLARCNNRSLEIHPVMKPAAQIPDKTRIEQKLEWLKLTGDVVRKVNYGEANEVFRFLEQDMIVAAPLAQGIKILEKAKTKKWIVFVSLSDADKNLGDVWRSIVEKQAVAQFMSREKFITVRNDVPFSPVGKAIVLLHEGYHAYLFVKNPYTEQDSMKYAQEEVKAHSFQNRIMRLLGGEKYQDLLNRKVEQVSEQVKKAGGKIGYDFPVDPDYDPELAGILSEPESPMEQYFIGTSFWIHANFLLLEKNFKGDVENQKAVFLRTVYQDAGILRD